MNEIEGTIVKRKGFSVCRLEGEPCAVAPTGRRHNVHGSHVADSLA